MDPIQTTFLERRTLPVCARPWTDTVRELQAFADRRALCPRDLWVVVPFAQHLPLAREAWSQQVGSGWMPRFETTETLAAALRVPAPDDLDAPTGDPLVDRLSATRLLHGQSWVGDAQRRDPAMSAHLARLLVETTHQFMDAAAARAPQQRPAWWAQVKARLQLHRGGPGDIEDALAQVACAWAQLRDCAPTDGLFAATPGAWAVVQAGEPDPLMAAVLGTWAGPALWLDLNPASPDLSLAAREIPSLTTCQDTEEEAQVAAARILRHVADGDVPLALVAQDRGLVRRIRALLDREGVRVHDETGWKLSTTRAGACVMGLLRISGPAAATEEVLDWLKGGFVDLPESERALPVLEAALRRRPVARAAQVRLETLPEPAQRMWRAWTEVCEPLARLQRASLTQWQQALRDALQGCGAWQRLREDPAGCQLLQAMRFDGAGASRVFAQQASQMVFERADHLAWVDEVLESASYRPAPMEPVEVVIAPLSRCMLRPFAAVVMPGCDQTHLGAPARVGGCLSESVRRDLGLPTRDQSWQRERLALAHVLGQPQLSLSWRRTDQGEPLQLSALLEPVHLALRRQQCGWRELVPARQLDTLDARPVGPTAPSAPSLLPARLSATGYEALRACPYRFFALRMLGLEEIEVLDDELDRRDQGTWLHMVLHAFHLGRERVPKDVQEDVSRLLAIGRAKRESLGFDEVSFLAEWLQFERLAPAYVEWLHGHEEQGWCFRRGEWPVAVPGPGPVELRGVIDRVDERRADGPGREVRLIDYKISSAENLKARVRAGQGLEDTQLAFYAALWEGGEGGEAALEAGYLALDVPVEWVEHKGVGDSAAALREGLAADLGRLAGGAALPPLGEGPACAHCAAVGLCRKGHWADQPAEVVA
jgi:ATP-dependent helicase/nuclease subunit B